MSNPNTQPLPTANNPETLDTGVYLIAAACPRCGVVEDLLVKLSTVLTMPEDDAGTLRVRLKGKARDHDCRQLRLTQDQEVGR